MPIGTYLEQLRREREKSRPSPLLFSRETKQILENQGCRFYTLKGRSVFTVLQETNQELNLRSYFLKSVFSTPFYEDIDAVGLAQEMDIQMAQAIDHPSLISEVAVPPQSILQGSYMHTLPEQQHLINQFSQTLQKQIGRNDMKTIIGTASDYVEIYYQNRQESFDKNNNIFEEEIRTSSELPKTIDAEYWREFLLGEANCHIKLSFSANSKIYIDIIGDSHKNVGLYISPLIVPIRI